MCSNLVLVLGGESLTAFGVLKSLPELERQPILVSIGVDKSIAGYTNKAIFRSLESYDNKLLEYLLSFSGVEKGLIICVTDKALFFVDENRSALKENWNFFDYDKKSIDNLYDKTITLNLFSDLGFYVPKFYKGIDFSDYENKESYPLIVKSIKSFEKLTGDKVIIYNHDEMLEFSKNNKVLDGYFFQSLEDISIGSNSTFYEVFLYRNKLTKKISVVSCIKNLIFPLKIGSSAKITVTNNKAIEKKCIEFLEFIDFDGVAEIELFEKGDEIGVIEANYRPGTPIAITAAVEKNLIAEYCGFDSTSGNTGNESKKVFYIREPSLCALLFKKEISLYYFLKNIFSADVYLLFDIYDLKPLMMYIIKKIVARFK